MRITVTSQQEHIDLLQRMAAKGYTRPYYVELSNPEDQRTLDQNACMWAALSEVSRAVEWHGQKLTPDAWKDVISASIDGQRAVPGIDGGIVFLGKRTSKMSKQQLSDMLEAIFAFGTSYGVQFKTKEYNND